MSKYQVMAILGVVFAVIGFAVPIWGQQNDIVITNADTVQTTMLEFGQGSLNLVRQLEARTTINYANTLQHILLTAIPAPLQTHLNQVSSRIILNYAQTNQDIILGYPTELINDTSRPFITRVAAGPFNQGNFTLSWSTNELTTGSIYFGQQPGVYTQTVTDTLYTKSHQVILPNLTAGSTYYYQIESVDQSGNVSESKEWNFKAINNLYLPLVTKDSNGKQTQ